jgi:hypothetical protein
MELRTSTKAATTTHRNVVFMPSIYNQTMNLLRDAQEYFALFGDEDQQRFGNEDLRNLYNCEMSRITLRLSSVMAWFIARRAVATGQIAAEDQSHFTLEFQDICRVDTGMMHGLMPPYVCHLLDCSHELYERVLRLDGQQAEAVH